MPRNAAFLHEARCVLESWPGMPGVVLWPYLDCEDGEVEAQVATPDGAAEIDWTLRLGDDLDPVKVHAFLDALGAAVLSEAAGLDRELARPVA